MRGIKQGILCLLILFFPFFAECKTVKTEYVYNEGTIFGSYFHITYKSSKDYQADIEKILHDFNSSLSTYDKNSIISRVNQNDTTVTTDQYFEDTYAVSKEVSEKTDGLFDITVAPIVRAWGFGSGGDKQINSPNIDSLRAFVGYKKITLENHKIIKQDSRICLDVNAIAPGKAADVIAEFLEKHHCCDYLVEIGGEIMCKGLNADGKKWSIGVDKPIDDPNSEIEEIQTVISINNAGVATSGNYRDFYYKNGKKRTHTINPKTGETVSNNLLSATIVAPSCALADGYATVCMVQGVENSLKMCQSIPGLECYLIYLDEDNKAKIVYSKGFEKYLKK